MSQHEVRVNSRDCEARLREAIDAWRPDRPRRWLVKHGGLAVEGRKGRDTLAEQYIALREEAMRKVSVVSMTAQMQGLPSQLCHLRSYW